MSGPDKKLDPSEAVDTGASEPEQIREQPAERPSAARGEELLRKFARLPRIPWDGGSVLSGEALAKVAARHGGALAARGSAASTDPKGARSGRDRKAAASRKPKGPASRAEWLRQRYPDGLPTTWCPDREREVPEKWRMEPGSPELHEWERLHLPAANDAS